jgi:hypothetical protein
MDHAMVYPLEEKQKKTGERRHLIWKRWCMTFWQSRYIWG